MEKPLINLDDKDLVIVAVTVIIMTSMFVIKDASIVTAGLSGLFGIAVGKKM